MIAQTIQLIATRFLSRGPQSADLLEWTFSFLLVRVSFHVFMTFRLNLIRHLLVVRSARWLTSIYIQLGTSMKILRRLIGCRGCLPLGGWWSPFREGRYVCSGVVPFFHLNGFPYYSLLVGLNVACIDEIYVMACSMMVLKKCWSGLLIADAKFEFLYPC